MSNINSPAFQRNLSPVGTVPLAVNGLTSNSFTFTPIPGSKIQTFEIHNYNNFLVYISWGKGSATAVVPTPGVFQELCAPATQGTVITRDLELPNGDIADTVAAIIYDPDSQGFSGLVDIVLGKGGQ